MSLGAPGASDPFPLNNFKYFLTLFSKFFSSFPHGTCSLSVSRRYSAFDGIYHRLWAAFPSNPTLRKRLVEWLAAAADGVLTLSDAPFQGTWARPATEDASLDYNSPMTLIGDFQVGLFPLRSPLLGESWLVSSPPPTDMLKLSGWSCLNSGRTLGVSLLRLGHGSLSKPTAACDYSIRTAAYQTGGLPLSSRKKRGAVPARASVLQPTRV